MNKVPLPIVLLGSAVIFSLLGFAVGQSGGLKVGSLSLPGSPSPNIMYITSPVTFFNGVVDKVEGNSVWVSQQVSQYVAPAAFVTQKPNQPPPTIPPPKKISYKIHITSATQISRPPTAVAYLLKTVTPAPSPKLTVKDIKAGQSINVNSNVDLRTLATDEFDATNINLPPITNTIFGNIKKISGTTITLKAAQPTAGGPAAAGGTVAPPKEIDYTVQTNADTEISRYQVFEPPKPGELPKQPQPEKLAISDLAAGQNITVYTDVDVTTATSFTALRIEPQIIQPVVAPPVVSPPLETPNQASLSPTTAAKLSPTVRIAPTTAASENTTF